MQKMPACGSTYTNTVSSPVKYMNRVHKKVLDTVAADDIVGHPCTQLDRSIRRHIQHGEYRLTGEDQPLPGILVNGPDDDQARRVLYRNTLHAGGYYERRDRDCVIACWHARQGDFRPYKELLSGGIEVEMRVSEFLHGKTARFA